MGSTLEDQKKKAPKPKRQKITVKPGQRKGYEQRLPSAMASADLRKRSPFGKASPRAAVLEQKKKLTATMAVWPVKRGLSDA
jgi:hypothetical protein